MPTGQHLGESASVQITPAPAQPNAATPPGATPGLLPDELAHANPTPPEETKQNAGLTDDWYVPAPSRGHRVPRPGVDEEEETVGEHLVNGGVEEATHDQMLEARKEELEQEGGIT